MDFEELFNETKTVEIEVVTLSGVSKVEANEGDTIADFKLKNNLVGFKIMNQDNRMMRDGDLVQSGDQYFVTRPKQNG